jgi:hypothetical protein
VPHVTELRDSPHRIPRTAAYPNRDVRLLDALRLDTDSLTAIIAAVVPHIVVRPKFPHNPHELVGHHVVLSAGQSERLELFLQVAWHDARANRPPDSWSTAATIFAERTADHMGRQDKQGSA